MIFRQCNSVSVFDNSEPERKQHMKIRVVFLFVIIIVMNPFPLTAYIDPGTSSAVFFSWGYLLTIITVVIGFLAIPFKKLYNFLKRRRSARKGSNDNPA